MPDPHDVCRDAQDHIAKLIYSNESEAPEAILGLLVGSRALGYATETSDVDVTVIVKQSLNDLLLQRQRHPSTINWSTTLDGRLHAGEINIVTITDTVNQIMNGDARLITALVLDPPIADKNGKLVDDLHLLARIAMHTPRAQNSILNFLEKKAKVLELRPSNCNEDTLIKILASGLVLENVYRATRDTRATADAVTVPTELAEHCRDMRASHTLDEHYVKLFINTVVRDRAVWNELRNDKADRLYEHYAEALAVAIIRDVYRI